MVASRRPLGRGIILVLGVIAAVALVFRLWMPNWDRRLEDARLVLIAPFDPGLTVDATVVGYIGLIAGGAAFTAVAAAAGIFLRDRR